MRQAQVAGGDPVPSLSLSDLSSSAVCLLSQLSVSLGGRRGEVGVCLTAPCLPASGKMFTAHLVEKQAHMPSSRR